MSSVAATRDRIPVPRTTAALLVAIATLVAGVVMVTDVAAARRLPGVAPSQSDPSSTTTGPTSTTSTTSTTTATTTTTTPTPTTTTAVVTTTPTPSIAAVPSAPRSLTASAGIRSVSLSWSPPTSPNGTIDHYLIERATATTGPFSALARVSGTSFTFTGLTAGTRFYFRVIAHNATGWSPASSTVSAVPAAPVPSAPRALTAKAGTGSVALSWLPPASSGGIPIDRYLIYRATAATGPFSAIASVTGTSFTFNGLTAGTRFYFRVFAHNATGWGPMSNTVSAVPTGVAPTPRTPSAPRLLIVLPAAGHVVLEWQRPLSTGTAPIIAYRVQRWTGSAWVNLTTTVPPNLTRFRVDGVVGAPHLFRVLAWNSVGLSPPSNIAGPRIPGAPTIVDAVATVEDAATTPRMVVTFAFGDPGGGTSPVTHFVVQRSTDGSNWTATTVPRAAGFTAYRDSGLTPDTEYRYRVAAVNVSGQGPWSTLAVVRAPTPCPDRSVPVSGGAARVTSAFHVRRSCDHAASEQDRVVAKEFTWDPARGWGSPGGTVLEACVRRRAGSTESTISVQYACHTDHDANVFFWFVITYPRDLLPHPPT
jgi:hypothetical protein